MAFLPVDVHEPDTRANFKLRVQLGALAIRSDGSVIGPLPENATPNGKTFDVAGVTTGSFVRIVIDVLSPVGSVVLETIKQEFVLENDGTLTPKAENNRPWHPRLRGPASLKATAGSFPSLKVDLGMILANDLVDKAALEKQYNPAFMRDVRSPFVADPHHGCAVHLLEFTRGMPIAWLIIVPPSLATDAGIAFQLDLPRTFRIQAQPADMARGSFDVTVFYRPAWDHSINTIEQFAGNDAAASQICRYIIDPPVFGPFFAKHDMNVGASNAQGKIFEVNPNVGLEGQLTRSRKKTLLVLPLPNGAKYDLAESTKLPELVSSLLVCLHAAGKIAVTRLSSVGLNQLALSGFSYGGDVAIRAWRLNRSRVDELYLFDPPSAHEFASNKEVDNWLREKRIRKLRLIGGNIAHKVFLQLASRLLPDRRKKWHDSQAKSLQAPNVWCLPEELGFWLGDPPYGYYSWAYAVPPKFFERPLDPNNYTSTPERFLSVGSPRFRDSLSDRSGLHAKGASAPDRTVL